MRSRPSSPVIPGPQGSGLVGADHSEAGAASAGSCVSFSAVPVSLSCSPKQSYRVFGLGFFCFDLVLGFWLFCYVLFLLLRKQPLKE